MYICICVYIPTCIHIYIIHVYTYVYTHIYMCVYVFIYRSVKTFLLLRTLFRTPPRCSLQLSTPTHYSVNYMMKKDTRKEKVPQKEENIYCT